MVQLVEKETDGKQVLWPESDAELKAESPRGLGPSLSLQTPEIKKPGEQTWDMQGGLRRLELGVWGAKAVQELAGAAGRPL